MKPLEIMLIIMVGVAIGVVIMAMLQMSRIQDDEEVKQAEMSWKFETGSQIPPRRPPPHPESMRAYEADTKRLNWLQFNDVTVTLASQDPRRFAVVISSTVVSEITEDIRHAIDSAMVVKCEMDKARLKELIT
jgi:hypothetical protein